MKIRKYACIAISAALQMTGCQATSDQDIVANKNDNQASQNETSQSVDDTIAIDENADGKVVSEAISDSPLFPAWSYSEAAADSISAAQQLPDNIITVLPDLMY